MKLLKITFLLVMGILSAKEAKLQEASFLYHSNNNGANWSSATKGLPTDAMVNEFLRFQGKTLAATNDHGLFVSEKGVNWEPIGENLSPKIKALASNGNTLFAAMWHDGIRTSVDQGKTWQERNFGLYDLEVNTIVSFDNLVYAGTANGIYTSWNNGKIWINLMDKVQINDLVVIGTTIYATSPIGLFQSDDHGKTWEKILEGEEVYSVHSLNDEVYALTYRKGVLRKDKGSTSWVSQSDGLPEAGRFSFALSVVDNTLWLGDGGNIYRLKPGSRSWEKVTLPWGDGVPISKIFAPAPEILLVALSRGC